MNTATSVMTNELPDLGMIKTKQKATWEDGNYAHFARYMEAGAIEILQGWKIPAGKQLLDVACGSGQTAIPAAKTGIKVTGIDIAENLIEVARKRAADAKLDAQFDIGDAEQLPYSNNSFEIVMSMFGAMFAPRPQQVSCELARVLQPGGRLFMANWTPQSMPAQMFKCVSGFMPPPAGVIPPVLWGDENTVLERLGEQFTDIKVSKHVYPQWQFPFDATDLVDLFRTCFGPVKRAFDNIDAVQQEVLRQHMTEIFTENSEFKNGVLSITGGEYLEVIATRR